MEVEVEESMMDDGRRRRRRRMRGEANLWKLGWPDRVPHSPNLDHERRWPREKTRRLGKTTWVVVSLLERRYVGELVGPTGNVSCVGGD